MANNFNFINNTVLVVPNDSIVTIKPHSSTSRSHKVMPSSSKTYNKQSSSSSSSYKYLSNKDGCKIQYKKTTSSTVMAKDKKLTSKSSTEYVSVKKSSYSNTGHLTNNSYGKVANKKNEYKSSSTVRVMDKRGYTEYSKQERVTRINYGYNKSSTGIGSSKSYSKSGGARK